MTSAGTIEVEARLVFIRGVEQSSDSWWTVAMVLLFST